MRTTLGIATLVILVLAGLAFAAAVLAVTAAIVALGGRLLEVLGPPARTD